MVQTTQSQKQSHNTVQNAHQSVLRKVLCSKTHLKLFGKTGITGLNTWGNLQNKAEEKAQLFIPFLDREKLKSHTQWPFDYLSFIFLFLLILISVNYQGIYIIVSMSYPNSIAFSHALLSLSLV